MVGPGAWRSRVTQWERTDNAGGTPALLGAAVRAAALRA